MTSGQVYQPRTERVPVDEATLIKRAKERDPAAFADIYDRHQPAIYRYILFRLNDPVAAEDLTSEVFVRLVERIDRFVYRGRPLLAWLYTIARNLVNDYRRQASRRQQVSLGDQMLPSPEDPEQGAERRLLQQQMARALSQLTEDQRQVVLLKFYEGYDNETVARILGKTVGAVKSLQHRSLAALQRILEGSGP